MHAKKKPLDIMDLRHTCMEATACEIIVVTLASAYYI